MATCLLLPWTVYRSNRTRGQRARSLWAPVPTQGRPLAQSLQESGLGKKWKMPRTERTGPGFSVLGAPGQAWHAASAVCVGDGGARRGVWGRVTTLQEQGGSSQGRKQAAGTTGLAESWVARAEGLTHQEPENQALAEPWSRGRRR